MNSYKDINTIELLQDRIQDNMQVVYQPFLKKMPNKAIILDAGCGTGRDSLFFKERGHMVIPMEDTSEQVCQMAGEYIGQAVLFCKFQDIHFKVPFDGIWACGSLTHVSKEELHPVLETFYENLKSEGVLYISFNHNVYEEQTLQLLLAQSDFKTDKIWITEHKDNHGTLIKWLNILASKK